MLFNSDIVNFTWKTDEGETESIVLLIFILWRCFNRRWMRGGRVVLAETISMTHSDTLYQLDISTFYFYESLLFQISLEIYKNVGLSLSANYFFSQQPRR